MGEIRAMKAWVHSIARVGVCVLLAIPFYLLGTTGLFHPAIIGYILAVALYWMIQAVTSFRHPLNGVLIVGLLLLLFTFVVPALARARSRAVALETSVMSSTSPNYRAALDAGGAFCLHFWGHWPGASERGCSAT